MTQHIIRIDDEVYDALLKVKHDMERYKRRYVPMKEAARVAIEVVNDCGHDDCEVKHDRT